MPGRVAFVLGAVVGEVTVAQCLEASESPWFEGPYGFALRDAVAYPESIPCKGATVLLDAGRDGGVYVPRARAENDGRLSGVEVNGPTADAPKVCVL